MPCDGLRGVDFIQEAVSHHYDNDWASALQHFVQDENNLWCPKRIRRNYESRNKHFLGRNPANADISAETGIPKNSDLVFEDTPEGSEHSGTESPEHAPAQVPKQHPSRLPRSSWQEHSAGGPNLAPEPEVGPAEPFFAVINSAAHPWHQHVHFLNVQNAQRTWETLRATQPCLQLPDKQPPALEDDFQQLFVQLVFQHMSRVFAGEPVAPLRLLLLGTAGTGKTFAVQTLLQLLHTRLQELHLPQSTVRVAAPTGAAAFNMRWDRLIHWFRPPHFADLRFGSDALLRFQQSLEHTQLLVFDEVSMIGRQMMGRIDRRLRQSKTGRDTGSDVLGGLCARQSLTNRSMTSCLVFLATMTLESMLRAGCQTTGLEVYSSFEMVVILQTPQRIRTHVQTNRALTQAEKDYNDEAVRFLRILHRLRDLSWTVEDYYWLCKRKRSQVSLGERLRFKHAPVLMDFRRTTETNPEHNCDFFNRMRLRRLAQETQTSVARFVAVHGGIDQREGLRLDSSVFSGLSADLEIAEGAAVPIPSQKNSAFEESFLF